MEPENFNFQSINYELNTIADTLSWQPSAESNALGRAWRLMTESPLPVEVIRKIIQKQCALLDRPGLITSYDEITQSLNQVQQQIKRVYPPSNEQVLTLRSVRGIKAELLLTMLERKFNEPFLRQTRTSEGKIEKPSERLIWLKDFITRELTLPETNPFRNKPLEQVTVAEWIEYSAYCADHIFLRFCDAYFYAEQRRRQGAHAGLSIPRDLKDLQALARFWRSNCINKLNGCRNLSLQRAIPKEIELLSFMGELSLLAIEHPLPKELNRINVVTLRTNNIQNLSCFPNLNKLILINATHLPTDIKSLKIVSMVVIPSLVISDSPNLLELSHELDQMEITIQCHANHFPLFAQIITPDSKIKGLNHPIDSRMNWPAGRYNPAPLFDFIRPYGRKERIP